MEEQKYILENQNSFELKDIFECGQCFRWNEQEDGSYIGVIKNGVIQVKKEKKICKEKNGAKEINKTKEIITFTGKCDGNLQEIVEKYFDLNRDYEKIKSQLENIDEYLKTSIEYGKGIRILNQDLWETIISFIISANNNIPRIKGIIERISQKYGNEIEWNGKKYYTFPTPEQLKDVTVQEFRNLGLGFRDIRLYETTQMILNKEVDLWVELGLQSMHDKTGKLINRGHDYQTLVEGVNKLRAKNIDVIIHIINGLPGETHEMMLETAKAVAGLDVQGIKIHLLHVIEGTPMHKMLDKGMLTLMEKDEYIDLVVDQLEILPPEMVIHRLTGDAVREELVGPMWSLKKWEVLNAIDDRLKERNTYQGRLYQKPEEN